MASPLGAASYTYLYSTDLDDAIDRIARLGFRSCELMDTAPHLLPAETDAARRKAIRARLAERGLTLTALNPTFLDLNLASTNAGMRREVASQICASIDLAADLEATFHVVGPGRRHPLLPPDLDWLYPMTLEAIGQCVRRAEQRGVTIVLENIPNLFLDRAEDLVRLCQDLASSHCRIVYDVANAFMVEDPVAGLDVVTPYLAYVHLSDTRRRRFLHAPVGTGEVDFAAFTRKLAELGYTGPTTLEIIQPADPDAGLAESARALEPLGWQL